MAGLSPESRGMKPTAAVEEQAAPEGEAPTPEEQAMYDQVVNNAYELIDGDTEEGKGSARLNQLMARIKKAVDVKDQVEGLSAAVVNVMVPVITSAKQNGMDIPLDVMLPAGQEVLERLAEDAEKLGIHKFTPEEREAAMYRATDTAREMLQKAGVIDQEAAKMDLSRIQQAEQSGQLEQMLPGISKASQRFEKSETEEPDEEGEDE